MVHRIGEIALLIRDYDEALAWFTEKLDFVVVADSKLPAGERWVTVAPLGGQTAVRLSRAETSAQVVQIGHQADERVLLYLHTDDFARDHVLYAARGIRFLEAPRREAYGTVAVFEDLYGNRWDLMQTDG
ncbi:MAG TPA: VOC family protein [Rhizomicrobium sp.]|nr:VOC family protein [Rhizomicrobium sp.]